MNVRGGLELLDSAMCEKASDVQSRGLCAISAEFGHEKAGISLVIQLQDRGRSFHIWGGVMFKLESGSKPEVGRELFYRGDSFITSSIAYALKK